MLGPLCSPPTHHKLIEMRSDEDEEIDVDPFSDGTSPEIGGRAVRLNLLPTSGPRAESVGCFILVLGYVGLTHSRGVAIHSPRGWLLLLWLITRFRLMPISRALLLTSKPLPSMMASQASSRLVLEY